MSTKIVPGFCNGEENSDDLSVMILAGKFRTIFFPIIFTETEAKCCQHGKMCSENDWQIHGPEDNVRLCIRCPPVYPTSRKDQPGLLWRNVEKLDGAVWRKMSEVWPQNWLLHPDSSRHTECRPSGSIYKWNSQLKQNTPYVYQIWPQMAFGYSKKFKVTLKGQNFQDVKCGRYNVKILLNYYTN